MARAKADDACRLAEAMARLGLSCRDAHRLHAGYVQSGTRGRELLLEKPELYLRAETEAGRPLSESPSPIEQLTGELDGLAGLARRTFRRLEDGRLRRALEPDRAHVERMACLAQQRAQELLSVSTRRSPMLDQSSRRTILELHSRGIGTRRIANLLGVSRGAVRDVIQCDSSEVPSIARVLAPATVGDVYASPCKKGAYARFSR